MLTTREAANKIGVSERTMEYLRSKGEGPPVTRIAERVLRYNESKLNEWLAARTTKTEAT
jgi:predicted DNA-binding transcriptional regulator AlpA